jgi:hypothetical protein
MWAMSDALSWQEKHAAAIGEFTRFAAVLAVLVATVALALKALPYVLAVVNGAVTYGDVTYAAGLLLGVTAAVLYRRLGTALADAAALKSNVPGK